MVASSGGVAARGRWNLSLFLAQTGLASSGQVHHVRQREDARLHLEVGPRIHRRNQGHTALPLNAKRRDKTHPSARRVREELGGEEDKGRRHRRLDFLSEEAPRTRPGTIKPPLGQRACRTTVNAATTVIMKDRVKTPEEILPVLQRLLLKAWERMRDGRGSWSEVRSIRLFLRGLSQVVVARLLSCFSYLC